MADWTTIPDSSIEPGKPIRSIDGLALRDNPVAIAEGAVGAPKINPIEAMAHLGAVGAVGTYAWLGETTTTATAAGGTRAGSGLRYAGNASTASYTNDLVGVSGVGNGGTPSGTWRAMGRSYGAATPYYGATLWLRIA